MIPGKYKDDDFPIPLDAAGRYGFDYLALGHWHSRYIHDKRTAYPGTHVPMGFDDTPGVLLVDIAGPGGTPAVSPVEVPPAVEWRRESWEIDDASLDKLTKALLEPRTEQEGAELVRRVAVRGTLSPEGYERLRQTAEQAVFGHLELETEFDIDFVPTEEEIEGLEAYGYLSEVAQALLRGEAAVVRPLTGASGIEDDDVRNEALKLLFSMLREEERS
jgi:DNA repair exonuclease SbcCD nuclease subunit